MIHVVVDWPSSMLDMKARADAIARYRTAAAFHRTIADEIAAGCDHRSACYPVCVEAAEHRRRARRCEAAAWLEEHPEPVRPRTEDH